MIERYDFADGKYTVISDSGKLLALRNGEPWRDLVGDNLIYWMLVEVIQLKAENSRLSRVVPCQGIPREGCNYLAYTNTVCNKCGEIHRHAHMVGKFFPLPSAKPELGEEHF